MTNMPSRSFRLRVAVGAIVGATLMAGCSGPAAQRPGGDGIDRARMYDVAEDGEATPTEIVEAGRAVDAARSGESVLVTYTVHNDTDEGRSAAAWRLYGADGAPLAEEHAGLTDEGSAHAAVIGTPDGFLVSDQDGPRWHVGQDGTRQKVDYASEPVAAQPGDIALVDGSARMFRPTTRVLFTAAPRPRANQQGWTVTADGAVWMQGTGKVRNGPVPFYRSTRGKPWEQVASYAPGKREYVQSSALTAVGNRVVVPVLAGGREPDKAGLVALLVRPGAVAPGRPWKVLTSDVGGDGWWDVRTAALDATTVLVGGYGTVQYLVDLTDSSWRLLKAPTREGDWSYTTENGRIYARHLEHADAWFTDDRAKTWSHLPH